MAEAEAMVRAQSYFEVAYVHGRINGATAAEITRLRASGKPVIGDVDYQGAAYYRKYAPSTQTVFLIPPSYDQWKERVRRRYHTQEEFDSEWIVRRESAVVEIERALADKQYHFVVNDDITHSIDECLKIIGGSGGGSYDDASAREVARSLLSEIKKYS
jgi:guanylate kinase